MKKKISIFDKIFSFRDVVIKQYIENELSDYIDKIDFENDIMRRHWMFFFVNSFHIFILIGIFSTILIYIIKYQKMISEMLQKGDQGINVVIGTLSFFTIFLFLIYIIKANFINKLGILVGFIMSGIGIFISIPENLSISFFITSLFITASILVFIFLIEIILKSVKIIYDVLIDYKNDFIVVYPEGLYISEKEGALYHSTKRIMFDEIVDVSSREKGIFGTLFGFGKLKISIMGTGDDYEFRYCKNIGKVPTKLNEKRIHFSESKKMKGKKNNINQEIENNENGQNILTKTCKPFKSRLRDDIIKTLNLK